jgi:hypothetical protein
MRVIVLPQADIVTVVKVFALQETSKEDDPSPDDSPFKEGQYCLDSGGRFWREVPEMTMVLAAIDFDDAQMQRERKEARSKARVVARQKKKRAVK